MHMDEVEYVLTYIYRYGQTGFFYPTVNNFTYLCMIS